MAKIKTIENVKNNKRNREEVLGINPLPSVGAKIELVFGLIGPTGVDLNQVSKSLRNQLKGIGYQVVEVRLSKLIHPFLRKSFHPSSEYDRIDQLMTAGTLLRKQTSQADIVARLGIAEIRQNRGKISGNELTPPTSGVAYIVRSFKRPEEVDLFRTVYGKAFNLISVFSPRQKRIDHLRQKFEAENGIDQTETAEQKAIRLINRDFREDAKLGQKVSKTYPLADFFLSNNNYKNINYQVSRLVKLIFGYPYISPTKDEQGIFFAHAAAMRSLDLSRQVGAAITNHDGDIVSTGCNEVPKFRGGLYWEDDADPNRDFELGEDANVRIKFELVQDFFIHLKNKGWLSNKIKKSAASELTKAALENEDGAFLREAKVFDVIEFGRAVHGEMAAITQAAKLGIQLKDTLLYCTTFPCHLCARHIVSSGIKEVVFIEPYEKSRTGELYKDSISIEPHETVSNKAIFRSFVGVAPRRYIDFFAMTKDKKNADGTILDIEAIGRSPKITRPVLTYLFLEDMIISQTNQPK